MENKKFLQVFFLGFMLGFAITTLLWCTIFGHIGKLETPKTIGDRFFKGRNICQAIRSSKV